jgi:hypothetical protein
VRPARPVALLRLCLRRSPAAVIVLALAAPTRADAHIRSGIVATDYRAAVLSVPASAVRVRVYASDRALGLVVARGHVVSVLASSGAPVMRIDARRGSRTVVWHDTRLGELPPSADRGRWVVPLVVDGTRTRIEGRIWRVAAPPLWPWLILGLPFLAATALVLAGSRRRLRFTCGAAAGLAVVTTLVIAVGFAIGRSASVGRLLEGFDEAVLAAVGVVFFVRGASERRAMAAVGLGFLALVVGCLKLAALTHGVVLSALPATATRAGVALALWSGITAVVYGGRLLAGGAVSPSLRHDAGGAR